MTKLIPKIQTFKGIPYGSIQEFLSSLHKKELYYSLPAPHSHRLKTKEGCIINLDVHAFSDRNRKSVQEKIHLQIREYRSRKDLLFSEYTTGANGYLIDVHQLIDIRLKIPFATGIRLNKPIQLTIPLSDTIKPHQLQIFEQGPSSIVGLHQNNSLDWKPSNTPLLIRKGSDGVKYGRIELDQLRPILIGKALKVKRKATKQAMFSLKVLPGIHPYDEIKAYLLFADDARSF